MSSVPSDWFIDVNPLSAMYGAAASWRRRWYAREPSRARRLARPVISVGNLRVGGSGKTPVVACLAEALLQRGEHPAILSRGYGRRHAPPGATVVSDGAQLRGDLASSGDEPLMLARRLPRVPVVVADDRYLAGTLAERQLGATVHLLDDGFQHLKLARDVDLLLVDESDLAEPVLPVGRLREPIENAAQADALLVTASSFDAAARVGAVLGVPRVVQVTRALMPPRWLDSEAPVAIDGRVLAMAGIARPSRFFHDLEAAGAMVAERMAFADHHPYTQRDVDRVIARARAAGAAMVATTEKDAVRLGGLDWHGLPVVFFPLEARIMPEEPFMTWLVERLRTRR